MKIRFYIRPSKEDPEKTTSVRIRLSDGRGKDFYARTYTIIKPQNWDQNKQEFKSTKGEIRIEKSGSKRKKSFFDENVKLRNLKSEIESAYNLLEDHSKISKDWLQEIIDRKFNVNSRDPGRPENLFEFIEQFIKEAEAGRRLNKRKTKKASVGYKQIREYHATFDYLKKFSKHRNQRKDIDFSDIDNNFYFEFREFLEDQTLKINSIDKKLAMNTIGKKIMTLKIFLNDAIVKKYDIPDYQSKDFFIPKEISDTVALTKEELDQIYDLDLSDNPSLDKVRDLFIIACWTGLRFGDWQQIESYNIKDDMIELKQSKTEEPVVIPLHHTVKTILEKYNYNLPRISNQKFNEYVKKVADKAGINSITPYNITRGGKRILKTYPKYKLISAHTGRRTFASNLYRDGVSTVTIMALTGHKSESSFLRYIRVPPQDHAKLIKAEWERQAQNKLKVV